MISHLSVVSNAGLQPNSSWLLCGAICQPLSSRKDAYRPLVLRRNTSSVSTFSVACKLGKGPNSNQAAFKCWISLHIKS